MSRKTKVESSFGCRIVSDPIDAAPGRARTGGTAEERGSGGVGFLFLLATVGLRGFGHDGGRSVSVLHVARRGRHHAGCRTGREADRQGPEGQCTKNDFFHSGMFLFPQQLLRTER